MPRLHPQFSEWHMRSKRNDLLRVDREMRQTARFIDLLCTRMKSRALEYLWQRLVPVVCITRDVRYPLIMCTDAS
eukprot:6187656-Pleurochrysis_carterae.AAC.1